MDSVYTETGQNDTVAQTADTQFFIIVTAFSGYMGIFSLLINVFILVYITRLLFKKTNSFLVQLTFVSLIDAGAGLSLFAISQLSVRSPLTETVCASMVKSVVAFCSMSKGNILCICIQRFIFSLNLRSTGKNWKTKHTVTIVAVNVIIGVLVSLVQQQTQEFITEAQPERMCSPAILQFGAGLSSALLFWAGFIMVLSSDVLCILTIRKLWRNINNVDPGNELSHNSNSTSESAIVSVRRNHRHAILTIQIILIVFTFSSLPMLIMVLLQNIYKTEFDPAVLRLSLLITFIAMLSNPLLIMTRTRDLRQIIRDDITQLVSQTVKYCRDRCPCNRLN